MPQTNNAERQVTLNGRFGSKADIGLPPVDVRFTPKSGHSSAPL
jgi:hypothetical protein